MRNSPFHVDVFKRRECKASLIRWVVWILLCALSAESGSVTLAAQPQQSIAESSESASPSSAYSVESAIQHVAWIPEDTRITRPIVSVSGSRLGMTAVQSPKLQRIISASRNNTRKFLLILPWLGIAFGTTLWVLGAKRDVPLLPPNVRSAEEYALVFGHQPPMSCNAEDTVGQCQRYEHIGQALLPASAGLIAWGLTMNKERGGLRAIGKTGTTKVRKTYTNRTRCELTISIDGPTFESLTLLPGTTKTADLEPGQYREIVQPTGNEAEPYRELQVYERGVSYGQTYYVG
jgi:hypothetical protein